MADYTNGKIYKIEPLQPDKEDDVYIGSTTKEYLSQRLATHKYGFMHWKKTGEKKLASYDLFEKYGFENCKIVLLENVKCSSKDELVAVENKYIHNIQCINIIGRKAYNKVQRNEILQGIENKAKQFDDLLEKNEDSQVTNKINEHYDKKSHQPKIKVVKEKKIISEAAKEHLAKIREKAIEAKKLKKMQRLKSENLEALKSEIKVKEYNKLKDIVDNFDQNYTSKFMHYGQIIDTFEKKFNKNILEILLEYQDLKSSNIA